VNQCSLMFYHPKHDKNSKLKVHKKQSKTIIAASQEAAVAGDVDPVKEAVAKVAIRKTTLTK
jgi:hypothetical protein